MVLAGRLTIFCLSALAALPALAQDERAPGLSYVVVDGLSIPDPLTEEDGDAERGREIFASAEIGGCVACHKIGGDGGEGGPALDDAGRRLSESAIRLWIVNPSILKEDATMPAYYTLAPARQGEPQRDAPPLSAQQIEDLVAFLDGLTKAPPSASGN